MSTRIAELLGRSMLPLGTLTLLAGTIYFGPWFLLVGALVAWRLAGRYL